MKKSEKIKAENQRLVATGIPLVDAAYGFYFGTKFSELDPDEPAQKDVLISLVQNPNPEFQQNYKTLITEIQQVEIEKLHNAALNLDVGEWDLAKKYPKQIKHLREIVKGIALHLYNCADFLTDWTNEQFKKHDELKHIDYQKEWAIQKYVNTLTLPPEVMYYLKRN